MLDLKSRPQIDEKEFARKTRRAFVVGGAAAVAGFGAYTALRSSRPDDQLASGERRILEVNEKIAHDYLDDQHLASTYPVSEVGKLKPNGDLGLDDELEPGPWNVKIEQQIRSSAPKSVSLDEIKQLPKTDMVTKLHCIEGWSTVVHWTGARFSEFTRQFISPDLSKLPPYVYLETPDEEYYVALDRKSALHPQTLLCYGRNGQTLEEDHGAPLRLVIPVKYGIKNIKRIGLIRYTDKRPADYWAEQGYDWFAGL